MDGCSGASIRKARLFFLSAATPTIAGTITGLAVDDAGALTVSLTGGGTHEVTLPTRVFPAGALARCDGADVDATPIREGRAVRVVCGATGDHVLVVTPR